MAVQPETQKKGIVHSTLGIADDLFSRLTTGISAGEFRRMLRGETPSRARIRA